MPRAAVLVLAAVGLVACTSTAGPFVRDVRYGKDGRLVVERCTVNVSSGFFGPEVWEDDCHTAPLPAPEQSPTAPRSSDQ